MPSGDHDERARPYGLGGRVPASPASCFAHQSVMAGCIGGGAVHDAAGETVRTGDEKDGYRPHGRDLRPDLRKGMDIGGGGPGITKRVREPRRAHRTTARPGAGSTMERPPTAAARGTHAPAVRPH